MGNILDFKDLHVVCIQLNMCRTAGNHVKMFKEQNIMKRSEEEGNRGLNFCFILY